MAIKIICPLHAGNSNSYLLDSSMKIMFFTHCNSVSDWLNVLYPASRLIINMPLIITGEFLACFWYLRSMWIARVHIMTRFIVSKFLISQYLWRNAHTFSFGRSVILTLGCYVGWEDLGCYVCWGILFLSRLI